MAHRMIREFGTALVLLTWCAALLACRVCWTRSLVYAFLAWNLFLAALPLLFAAGMRVTRTRIALAGLGALWLLFFPNAPYILTDLLHLKVRQNVPLWYDLLLLLSAAGTGLFLGLLSLRHVHERLREWLGGRRAWLIVAGVVFLSAFGVYLGRFARWNSWDVIAAPWALAWDIARRVLMPWQHLRTWAVTLGFGTLLLLAYVATHVLTVPATLKRGEAA